jgi:hypothetical protein
MLRLSKILLLVIIFTVICSTRAYACGMCVFAIFDEFLPPIYFWCIIATVWYIAVSLIGIKYGIKLANLLNGGTVAIVVFAGLAGALTMFGPVTLLPLALPAVITTIFAIINFGPFKQNKNARVVILCIGCVFLILTVFGLLWCKKILTTRTDAKVFIQWNSTMTGRGLMAKFKQKEPASLVDYRYIVDNGKGFAVAEAAKRIGIIGDPKIDKPRLKLALAKVEESYNIKAVQDAIDLLSVKEADSTRNLIKK